MESTNTGTSANTNANAANNTLKVKRFDQLTVDELGASEIFIEAQVQAQGFYEKLGLWRARTCSTTPASPTLKCA